MRVRPPGVSLDWDSCNVEVKALLIAYNHVRSIEEVEAWQGQR